MDPDSHWGSHLPLSPTCSQSSQRTTVRRTPARVILIGPDRPSGNWAGNSKDNLSGCNEFCVNNIYVSQEAMSPISVVNLRHHWHVNGGATKLIIILLPSLNNFVLKFFWVVLPCLQITICFLFLLFTGGMLLQPHVESAFRKVGEPTSLRTSIV
jgi:hypothetical protein